MYNLPIMSKIGRYITEIMLVFLSLYAFIPFLSPILFSSNSESTVAKGIQKVYSHFCHQRVDRSMFLFGGDDSKYFFTLDEYEAREVGTDWGNDEVGYKVAFCIRDIGVYTFIAIFGLILVLWMNKTKRIKKFPWLVIILLMLPMVIDGLFQTASSIFQISWVPEIYMESLLKRFVTGALFGIAAAMIIFPYLKEASDVGYNEK